MWRFAVVGVVVCCCLLMVFGVRWLLMCVGFARWLSLVVVGCCGFLMYLIACVEVCCWRLSLPMFVSIGCLLLVVVMVCA